MQKDNQSESDKNARQGLPVFTLNESLQFCAKIYTELGKGDYHNKDLIAETHGVVYNSIKQKFSTAQYYGLLELKHAVGYKLTDLFLKIHKPENDWEKVEGMIESLRKPEIYNKLIEELNGHPLPSEQGLSSRLLRTFGIKEYAASKAAQIFIANLKNNGLTTSDNVLQIVGVDTIPKNQRNGNNGSGAEKKVDPLPQPGYIEIPVPLNGGKRAYIKIPEDYKSEDCERIAKFVEALK